MLIIMALAIIRRKLTPPSSARAGWLDKNLGDDVPATVIPPRDPYDDFANAGWQLPVR